MNKKNLKKILFASTMAFALSATGSDFYEKTDDNYTKDEDNLNNDYSNKFDILDRYLEEQLKYYRENPEAIDEDIEKEIIIDKRGNNYTKLISTSIQDIKNEYGDIALIHNTSIGNGASTGDRNSITNIDSNNNGAGNIVVAIVGVKSNAEYPFAVAKYNMETNTLGNIIGWFKDEDVFAYCDVYSEVIEKPICKYISYGNIADFDIDEKGNIINDTYWQPYGYTGIEDNCRHGIKIDYTEKEIEGYYSLGDLYISKNKKEFVTKKLDEKNLNLTLKFNIKNN